jgi:hypothetical protein
VYGKGGLEKVLGGFLFYLRLLYNVKKMAKDVCTWCVILMEDG